jgi:hypothetical protein
LNCRFLELSSVINPGKQPKLDKANILSDAARMLVQLRGEAEKLEESNDKLRETIKDLKVSLYCFMFLNRISGPLMPPHVFMSFNLECCLENASCVFVALWAGVQICKPSPHSQFDFGVAIA